MSKLLSHIILLFFASSLLANPTIDFEKGNQSFKAGDFEAAVTAYQKVLEQGFSSKELHYNLGNAYMQQKKIGPAMLHLEKAQTLAPFDQEIAHNLKIAKRERKDEFGELPTIFLKKWWVAARDSMSPTAWALLTILAFWLGVLGLIGWLLSTIRKRKKYSFLSAWVMLSLGIIFLALGLSRLNTVKDSGYAILMSVEQNLHEGADVESPEILKLHEGTKVQVRSQIGDWYEVRLVNGEVGWLPVKTLSKI